MIWENFVTQFAARSRKRAIANALVYGLSLSVRFTSATGEEVEIPPQALNVNPMTSVMINDGARLLYRDSPSNLGQPAGFRRWLIGLRGCRTTCESPAMLPGCPAPP